MKIALVHDDFCQKGGAENLFAQIAQIYPNAPIYTALVNWSKLPVPISQNRVRPSFMQKIPFAPKFQRRQDDIISSYGQKKIFLWSLQTSQKMEANRH